MFPQYSNIECGKNNLRVALIYYNVEMSTTLTTLRIIHDQQFLRENKKEIFEALDEIRRISTKSNSNFFQKDTKDEVSVTITCNIDEECNSLNFEDAVFPAEIRSQILALVKKLQNLGIESRSFAPALRQ